MFAQTSGRNEVAPVLAGLPRTVRFREVEGRGLLVSAWINGAGPFTFAVDTGAGATILSGRVAAEAHLVGGRSVTIGGMSGTGSVGGNETVIRSLAVGDAGNLLPSKKPVIVTERLAPGVDGVIDPAEAYWPLGFEIDMARGEMSAFDPRVDSLRRASNFPPDGAIVPWLTDGQSRRPFVMLEGGRRALIDTGSGFGLALTEEAASSLGIIPGGRQRRGDIRDLAGGSIPAHRISPTTVRLGTLVLRGVPTDLLPAARAGSPILLGRDALRPFRLSFDPLARLIRIIPG
ncbi:MAG TPA: aspartyl protease family protein [Pyrinomonadaceae bacterium]|nr:aspartyl protease family protein [Pyrinomonadaceae bacterium]